MARNLGPADLLEYPRDKLKGLLLEEGSAASHAAIVARETSRPSQARLDAAKASSAYRHRISTVVADATEADLVLINHALTPVQERNLERQLERRVVDRTGLILDIFAQRAQSHEGKLQVELAQLRHLATRLVRGWTHLERQRGGVVSV